MPNDVNWLILLFLIVCHSFVIKNGGGNFTALFSCYRWNANNGANASSSGDPDFVVFSHFCSQFIHKQEVSAVLMSHVLSKHITFSPCVCIGCNYPVKFISQDRIRFKINNILHCSVSKNSFGAERGKLIWKAIIQILESNDVTIFHFCYISGHIWNCCSTEWMTQGL